VLKRSVRGGGSLDISRLPGIPGGRKHYTLVAESTIPWWQKALYLVAESTIPWWQKARYIRTNIILIKKSNSCFFLFNFFNKINTLQRFYYSTPKIF
jgi:hypothetical protein